MNEETGRSIPAESDYEGELSHGDGILSESVNTQGVDSLPGRCPQAEDNRNGGTRFRRFPRTGQEGADPGRRYRRGNPETAGKEKEEKIRHRG